MKTTFNRYSFFLLGFVIIGALGIDRASATVGATVPFTTYEGEAGTLGGGATVVSLTSPPTSTVSSPAREASGHAYAQLTGTGQSVTWTNNTSTSFTAMSFRICIPDSAGGGGINSTIDLYVNGVFRQAIPVSSTQTWEYTGGVNTPSSGNPYDFFEESHLFITGAPIAPGSTFTLKQDSTNTAAFYYVDCVDLEAPPAPLTQPANSLSIVTYGAVANNSSFDSTTAIQNCINAAATAGKSVWIPQGTFYLLQTGGLTATSVTIQGAGMWYSVLYHLVLNGAAASSIFHSNSCTLTNFAMDSNAPTRLISDGGGITMWGNNWLVNNVWAEHTGSGAWLSGTNGMIENCRMTHTWADGINLNNGNGAVGMNIGNNLTAINNFDRGNADDDGIVIDSTVNSGCTQMTNISLLNNTVIGAQAHDMATYGGNGVNVLNNYLSGGGMGGPPALGIGSFGNQSFSPVNVVVKGNTIYQGGSYSNAGTQVGAMVIDGYSDPSAQIPASQLWIGSNTINNSLYSGIQINGQGGFNAGLVDAMSVENNAINSPGTSGILIDATAWGNGDFLNNTVTGLGTGQVAMLDNSSGNFIATAPIMATTYNAVFPTPGGPVNDGTYIGNISSTNYLVYDDVALDGITAFVASVASANAVGMTFQVHLDSPTGTVIGTCSVPNTGGGTNWETVTCPITATSGLHNIYLVAAGTSGTANIEWLDFTSLVDLIDATNFSAVFPTSGGPVSGSDGTYMGHLYSTYYMVYNNVNLKNMSTFAARVASANATGLTIKVCLDSPTGTVIGTLPVPNTGGWFNWVTETCPLTGASGTHNIYLVVSATSGSANMQWLSFAVPSNETALPATSYSSAFPATGGPKNNGTYVGSFYSTDYLVYNNINLNNMTEFAAVVASANAVGMTLQVRLDSPTGTLIGTISVPNSGGWFNWVTATCPLTGVSGTHNIYLVANGTNGGINISSLDFFF